MNETLKSRYKHIKDRCYNIRSKSYKRYGGRGIKMCQEWLSDYTAFESWALTHGFQEGLAIDRIDNDGDYSPENCRFVTLKENNQKRRTSRYYTIDGVTKNLQQWCEEYGMCRGTIHDRLEKGWSIKDALTQPIQANIRNRKELLGKRFGRLVVVAYAGDACITKDNNSRWICQCDCGNTVVVGTGKLKSGHTKSCGCFRSDTARKRMTTDNPMKTEEQRRRMVEHNPMKNQE